MLVEDICNPWLQVVHAVRGKVPVLFDGGVRRGTDVFKALALGAQAVLVSSSTRTLFVYNINLFLLKGWVTSNLTTICSYNSWDLSIALLCFSNQLVIDSKDRILYYWLLAHHLCFLTSLFNWNLLDLGCDASNSIPLKEVEIVTSA